jgi:hypothetical protein
VVRGAVGRIDTYTLLETAKLDGTDPAKYLREAALADTRGELLLPGGVAN